MQFNSIDFMLFFPIVLAIYFIIPKKSVRGRVAWLLVASYYFYMSWNPIYALLIAGSTEVTFISGILIKKYSKMGGMQGNRNKKIVLVLCLVINLGTQTSHT